MNFKLKAWFALNKIADASTKYSLPLNQFPTNYCLRSWTVDTWTAFLSCSYAVGKKISR